MDDLKQLEQSKLDKINKLVESVNDIRQQMNRPLLEVKETT